MSSTLEHFSHPKHPLVLKESVVIGDDALCYICNNSVIASPIYTCTRSSDYTKCQSFYLHKSCAELPSQIHFHRHKQHPLDLLPRPNNYSCDVCGQNVKFSYACDDCQFDVCLVCAFQQRVLRHEGHPEHTLTLMPRKSLFKCDACHEKAEDSSYVCTTCDFWIHKGCAFSPFTIPAPTYHHHTLNLIYSVPTMHRFFDRHCNICQLLVHRNYWLYYCHKCTYFVHMKCATSYKAPAEHNIEEAGTDNEPDLVELPLHSKESLFELMISQWCKLQGKDENSITLSTANDPHIIKKHWSHKEHPLVLLQFTIGENDNKENNYEKSVLICNGCIQPITVSHPSYYACIKCGFFLHSFCAKLPGRLPIGVSPCHPQHPLVMYQKRKFYDVVKCGVCCYKTNGFYYYCKTCGIRIDMRCAFLPTKIRHKSHKHHCLVQRPSSNSVCSASDSSLGSRVEYGCETCSDFQIDMRCAFYPSRMKHKYDDHLVMLRHPPFFYEGVFYCEICEEQVNNQIWLYHCDECDHSFHEHCLYGGDSVKLGGTIELDINDQLHTLTLVLKMPTRKKHVLYYSCRYCGEVYVWNYFMECDGCGYLICCPCFTKIKASNKSIHF